MEKINIVERKLKEIKDFCGLELQPCSLCIKKHNKQTYFNVTIKGRTNFDNPEFNRIIGLIGLFGISRVESNGVNTVAIFFN